MKIITLMENTAGSNTYGNKPCHYEHGLSLYIETEQHKLLVDTGASALFLENAELLGIDLTKVDALILSHGHYDHSGGIMEFTKINSNASIYMQSAAGADYYHISPNDHRYIGIDKAILALPQCKKIDGELNLDEELYLFSNITGTKYPIRGNRVLKKKVGDNYVQDIFDHEQCLVITQKDKRILISGCAHNGIINILDRYVEIFHNYPDIVISGFHMQQKDGYSEEDITNIQNIASALLGTGAVFFTGHCTGQVAYDIMKPIMGDRLQPIHSGKQLL